MKKSVDCGNRGHQAVPRPRCAYYRQSRSEISSRKQTGSTTSVRSGPSASRAGARSATAPLAFLRRTRRNSVERKRVRTGLVFVGSADARAEHGLASRLAAVDQEPDDLGAVVLDQRDGIPLECTDEAIPAEPHRWLVKRATRRTQAQPCGARSDVVRCGQATLGLVRPVVPDDPGEFLGRNARPDQPAVQAGVEPLQ